VASFDGDGLLTEKPDREEKRLPARKSMLLLDTIMGVAAQKGEL